MSLRGAFARVRATGRLWNTLLIVLDAFVVFVATYVAYYARFDGPAPPPFDRWVLPLWALASIVYLGLFAGFGLYRLVLRYVGVDTLLRLLAAVSVGSVMLLAIDFMAPVGPDLRAVPLGVIFIQGVLVYLGGSAARMIARVFLYVRASAHGAERRRVLIIGAGSAGSLLLREIQNRPDLGLVVEGFLDDDPALKGRTIAGVAVLGRTADLADIVSKYRVQEVMVALPSASSDHVRQLLNAAADADVQTRIMPPLVIAKGSVSLHDLRKVDVEDLLGRDPTPIDLDEIAETITGKVIAVTGAAGSIGAELCRQIVRFGPRRLLLIEIDESRLYELWLELEHAAPGITEMSLCDIRDPEQLDRVFGACGPQVVLHAAAYKHVPLMEIAPVEAIKTNVMGTRNVIEACIRHDAERFVLISTDKAVAPANIMGLTKALAERIMVDSTAGTGLNAVAVRFGNVLGSRGSVVPIFEEQLRRGGPVTVTDPSVTRYFMTIPEAARLVLQAQAIGTAGDIFVLEMGDPVRIVDLARRMIVLSGVPADIEYIGLRAGEKLHEELTNKCEQLIPTARDKILRVDRVALPSPQFESEIDDLVAEARAGQTALVMQTIERLEPGFLQRDNPGCN